MKLLVTLFLFGWSAFTASAQNVGIGTVTPTDQLHTTGSVRFQSLSGYGTRALQVDSAGRLFVPAAGYSLTSSTAAGIPDNGCVGNNGVNRAVVISNQPLTDAAKIAVRINLRHTYDQDLRIYLVAPNGSALCLAAGVGGSGDDFTNTIFSDDGFANISTGSAPFTGTFKPQGGPIACFTATAVSTFGGFGIGSFSPNGTWSLRVYDGAAVDTGSFLNWTITFSGADAITNADQNGYIPYLQYGSLKSSPLFAHGNGSIGLGTQKPESSAALDITSTTKGFLPPRMTYEQILAIENNVVGLTVYDTDNKGLRFYDGSKWVLLTQPEPGFADAPGTFTTSAPTGSGLLSMQGVKANSDKTVLLCGYFYSGPITFKGVTLPVAAAGSTLSYFAKLTEHGELIWIKPLSASGETVTAHVTSDITGNIYLGGNFSGTVDFDPGPGVQSLTATGTSDAFYAKYDPNGNFLWVRKISGVTGSGTYVSSMVVAGGSLYATGIFTGTVTLNPGTLTSSGNRDIWVMKCSTTDGLNSNGGWIKKIGGANDDASAALKLFNGGLIMGGSFQSTCDFGNGISRTAQTASSKDAFLAVLTLAGATQNAYQLRSTGAAIINDIVIDASNNIYTCGDFTQTLSTDVAGYNSLLALSSASAASTNGFVIKFDPAFVTGWRYRIGGTFGEDLATNIAVNASGQTFISGTIKSSDFQVLGSSNTGHILPDVYLLKLDAGGAPMWYEMAGATGSHERSNCMDISADGKIIYTGIEFDPGVFKAFDGRRYTSPGAYFSIYDDNQ